MIQILMLKKMMTKTEHIKIIVMYKVKMIILIKKVMEMVFKKIVIKTNQSDEIIKNKN